MIGRPRRVIGLLSGTSMDGIDAALVRFHERAGQVRAELESFRSTPFSVAMRRELADATTGGAIDSERMARLDRALGERFAAAANRLIGKKEHRKADLIGSHGQTILHAPRGRHGASWQIGDPATIAVVTGLPTVARFRAADIASGGQGAPLLPLSDWLLYRSEKVDRVLLNIGGIANFTYLPAGGVWEDVLSYDTGPGNSLIDRISRLSSSGRLRMDRGGKLARTGRVDEEILRELMAHPYLRRRPPQSTGTEEFGDELAETIMMNGRKNGRSTRDLLATVTRFTAECAARAIRRHTVKGTEVYLCGGGTRNLYLVSLIEQLLPGRNHRRFEELGHRSEAREAIGFAVLAREMVLGRRYPMKRITGARGAPLLGELIPGDGPTRITIPSRVSQ